MVSEKGDFTAIRQLLEARQARLFLELKGRRKEIQQDHENLGRRPTSAFDACVELEESAIEGIIAARAEELQKIGFALQRIADGEYGNCEECKEPIPPQRLFAVPMTLYCVRCQERLERSSRRNFRERGSVFAED